MSSSGWHVMEGDGSCDALPTTDVLVFGRRDLEGEEGQSMVAMSLMGRKVFSRNVNEARDGGWGPRHTVWAHKDGVCVKPIEEYVQLSSKFWVSLNSGWRLAAACHPFHCIPHLRRTVLSHFGLNLLPVIVLGLSVSSLNPFGQPWVPHDPSPWKPSSSYWEGFLSLCYSRVYCLKSPYENLILNSSTIVVHSTFMQHINKSLTWWRTSKKHRTELKHHKHVLYILLPSPIMLPEFFQLSH